MRPHQDVEPLLAHEASQWLEAVRAGTEKRDELHAWLSQSQLHTDAFLKVLAVDIELDRAGELARQDPHHPLDVAALLRVIEPRVVPMRHISRAVGPEASPSRLNKWRRAGAAFAASVVVAVIALVATRHEPAEETHVATFVGEQRTVTLPDASRITLNASSQVRVLYSKKAREIQLQGEGLFKVTPHASRPFIVKTPSAQIRAVGTEFNVYERGDSGTLVSVLEGRVQVVAPGSSGSSAAASMQYLDAGQELQVFANGRIERRPHADVARTLAWRARRLPFEGATLDELVREFNRYSNVQFRIEGAIPSTRYGGIFDATDAQSLAEYLSREPDLVVERQGEQFVIRSQKTSGQAVPAR